MGANIRELTQMGRNEPTCTDFYQNGRGDPQSANPPSRQRRGTRGTSGKPLVQGFRPIEIDHGTALEGIAL